MYGCVDINSNALSSTNDVLGNRWVDRPLAVPDHTHHDGGSVGRPEAEWSARLQRTNDIDAPLMGLLQTTHDWLKFRFFDLAASILIFE